MSLEIGYLFILSSGVICLSTVLYNFVRQYCSIGVNCWFCNANFRIPFKNKNEWFCEQCFQFNGFKEDGDYSRHIPEQFDEALNQKYVKPWYSRNRYVFTSNGLCSICNANQDLKIKQLALYVPFREENYDDEIEIFKNKLEKSYKLCEKCENFVSRKLQPTSNAEYFENNSKTQQAAITRAPLFKIKFTKLKLRVLVTVTIATLAAFIFKATKSPTESDEYSSASCNFEQYLDSAASLLCCNFMLDYVFALSTAFLPYIFFNHSHSVIAGLLVLLASMISDDLLPLYKIFAISAVAIAFVIRYVTGERMKAQCVLGKLDYNLRNGLTLSRNDQNERDECETKSEFNEFNSSASLLGSAPLCGQFSDMNLGRNEKCTRRLLPQPSYSFKCDRLLVQPSKLKLDEFDYADKRGTSPTGSSGYESLCGGFFKKNADCVSEFDSISQVNMATRNHSLSNVSKMHSPLSPSNFHSTDALSLSGAERYYGAMRIHSLATMSSSPSPNVSVDRSQSRLEIKASVSIFQIVFYSFTCFILGFTFQLLVRQFFV